MSSFYRLCIPITLLLILSFISSAKDGNLLLKGTIVKKGCTIETRDITVSLGEIPVKHFKNTAGIKSPMIPFSIKLTNCSSPSVSLMFAGGEFGNTGLIALTGDDSAQGVVIELSNNNGALIALNKETESLTPNKDEDVEFNFNANYLSVSPNVKAGKANAEAIFSVKYN